MISLRDQGFILCAELAPCLLRCDYLQLRALCECLDLRDHHFFDQVGVKISALALITLRTRLSRTPVRAIRAG